MKRLAVGLLIAVLGVAAAAGVAFASGSGLPSTQEGDTTEQQGWLGIHITDITERVLDHFHLTAESGVVITRVQPEGPAGVAGLQAGDVIQAINGAAVENADQVIDAIRALSPGTVVTLKVLRGEEHISVEATLEARPEPLVPGYLQRLLGQGLLGNLLHAEYQILSTDDTVITVGLTLGKVQSTTDAGLLTIVRKDDQVVQFQTTADTKVIVGRHPINLVGLKEETPVLVVEKEGAVALVIGWPRDLLPHPKPLLEKGQCFHFRWQMPSLRAPDAVAIPERLVPEVFALPAPEALKERLHRMLPGPELQQKLQGRFRKIRQEWRTTNTTSVIQPEAPGKGDTL